MLYIIQNDSEVPPGILESELDRRGVECTLIHLYRGESLPDYAMITAVIVLGGAMGANDDTEHPFLTDLKIFIRGLVERKIPYLGICLGGQLLAAALRAEVMANVYPELGSSSITLTEEGSGDRLFKGVPLTFRTYQWHYDNFSIPRNGVRLAFSDSCPNQAFRIGSNAWGLQFHPEVNSDIVSNWSSSTPKTVDKTEEFKAAYRMWETDYCDVARTLVENFVAIANLRERNF